MTSQLEGKTFMFTGTLNVPRHEAQRIVEELGGIAGRSVTKSTDYLVVGEDQAGKSNKFITAGLLGITRVDEDYFWDLVKEARTAVEDYSELKGILTEKVFVNVLAILEARVKPTVVERKYPPAESMTYYSKENLENWLQSGGRLPKFGKRVCPYCNYEIPYSIENYYWYCFKCKLFSNVGQSSGRHTCVDWERLDIDTELGFYENCKVCGNVKFVAFSEVDRTAKSDVKCNYVHSLEFEAEVASMYAEFDKYAEEYTRYSTENWQNLTSGLGSEEDQKLYAQFLSREGKSEERYEKKMSRREARFKQKRISRMSN